MGIFSGITILDCARSVSGNLCAMILSDLGATLIHIDQPYEVLFPGPSVQRVSFQELYLMRGKKRVMLDLHDPAQQEAFFKIAKKADAFISDRQPAETAALNLSYPALARVNPQICYTAVSDFGQTGPNREKPSSDLVMQAFTGLMSVTGELGGPPMRAGLPMTELYSGLFGAIGTAAMLLHKRNTGEGQFLDISKADCMVAILENAVVNYLAVGNVPKPIGNRHSINVPFQEFRTRDGQDILITINRDNTFAALCRVLGCEELTQDPRYASSELRRQHRDECTQEVIDRVLLWDVKELEQKLNEAGVPCATIQSVDQIVRSENTTAREMLIQGSYPGIGTYTMPNSPFKFTLTPVEADGTVYARGMNTEEALSALS